jgi:hypothetical protein
MKWIKLSNKKKPKHLEKILVTDGHGVCMHRYNERYDYFRECCCVRDDECPYLIEDIIGWHPVPNINLAFEENRLK